MVSTRKKMKEIYSSDISRPLQKMLLGFALAKVMEDNGNYQMKHALYLRMLIKSER